MIKIKKLFAKGSVCRFIRMSDNDDEESHCRYIVGVGNKGWIQVINTETLDIEVTY